MADIDEYDRIVAEFGPTPESRTIGRILHEHQPYQEDTDGFEWHQWDAANAARALDAAGADREAREKALWDALVDSGYRDETVPEDAAALGHTVGAVLDALDGDTRG